MEEQKKNQISNNHYIKPKAIINLGKEIAKVISNCYNSQNAQEKLDSAKVIADIPDLKQEAKIKFIGDIMNRPKKERLAIAKKIKELLDNPK